MLETVPTHLGHDERPFQRVQLEHPVMPLVDDLVPPPDARVIHPRVLDRAERQALVERLWPP